jgi:hypothetical protein
MSMPPASTSAGGQDETALREQFEVEVRASGIHLSDADREPLFAMWAAQLPIRQRLRESGIRLEEEPSFTQKPAQWGGGVS